MTASLGAILWVVVFVLGLAASIALHEVGHLVPAKRFGVRVTQYMIGFGPTIWSRTRGETEYGLKAIPLGGYIRMIGMYPPKRGQGDRLGRMGSSGMFSGLIEGARQQSLEEIRPGDESRTFYGLAVWKKMIIMLGGPTMNLVLGTVILGVVLTVFGSPGFTTKVDIVNKCVLPVDAPADTACSAADPAAPAAAAGILPGDVILSVGGRATPTWDDVREQIRTSAGRSVTVAVERGGEQVQLQATPLLTDVAKIGPDGEALLNPDGTVQTTQAGFLGLAPARELIPQPVSAVPGNVGSTISGVAGVLFRLPEKLVGVAQAAFGSGERDPQGPVSVVGVGRAAGEIGSGQVPGIGDSLWLQTASVLGMLGGLNIALFVFNLIPLLPLDGGHVVGALIEGVRKLWARLRTLPDPGPFDVAQALPLAYGVALALLGMSALLVYADIVRPISLTG